MMDTLYFCTECKKECHVVYEDEGIGAFEYWGATGVDTNMVGHSLCCEADVTEEYPEDDC